MIVAAGMRDSCSFSLTQPPPYLCVPSINTPLMNGTPPPACPSQPAHLESTSCRYFVEDPDAKAQLNIGTFTLVKLKLCFSVFKAIALDRGRSQPQQHGSGGGGGMKGEGMTGGGTGARGDGRSTSGNLEGEV